MRRFRRRRRRIAAAALLPLTAILISTPTAAGATGDPQIDASRQSVPLGGSVTLRGDFPGARETPVEIRYRARGAEHWRTVRRVRTAASGRYRATVRPRRSGFWRAELQAAVPAAEPTPLTAPGATSARAADRASASEAIAVHSRTMAKLASADVRVGEEVEVRGVVTPAGAERRIVVRVGDRRVTTTAQRNGRFAVSWTASRLGSDRIHVRARSNRAATASSDAAGRLTVYRPAVASWYGPGLYGNPLGCGGTLTTSTIGVAHKTLPCGTKVRLHYRGHSVTARVIDRGPYSGNREFDLTSATRQRLRFPDVGTVLSSR